MTLGTLRRARAWAPASLKLAVGLGVAGLSSAAAQQQRYPPAAELSISDDGSHKRDAGREDGSKSEQPTWREEVIGSYEDRIRNFSSAERVFEFFASVTNEKGTFMTPADFARSITPYQHRKGVKVGSDNFKYNFQAPEHHGPTQEELDGYKRVLEQVVKDSRITLQEAQAILDARGTFKISAAAHHEVLKEMGLTQAQIDDMTEACADMSQDSFIALVDMDGDGLISYEEYMFFRVLMALPRRKLAIAFRMFDRDDSGAIDNREFEAFMNVLGGQTNFGKADVTHGKKSYRDIIARLFPTEVGSEKLTLEQFAQFVLLLQREALVMQFNQWDERGEGMLTATNFAKFLVTKVNADRRLYKQFLQRAESEAVAQLEVNISLEEFLSFEEVLHHLPEMEVAMKISGSVEGKGLGHVEFIRAVHAALEGGRLQQQAADPFPKLTNSRIRKRDSLRQAIFRRGSKDAESRNGSSLPLRQLARSTTMSKQAAEEKAEALSDGIVQTLFALLDADGNGRLDQQEFMTLMTRQASVPDQTLTVIPEAMYRASADE